MMDNIRIIFILFEKYKDQSEASQPMLEAFEQCKQNVSTNVTWVKENHFGTVKLNKTDFVVFEEFEGDTFEKLKESKCARILGPWAVSVCLMEGKPIPNFPWPIYNVAMYDCIVTCSHLSRINKTTIQEKIEMMGGCYVDTLLAKNTHLVTGSAKSEKYLMAAEAGLKLMCPTWVEAVWSTSQSINVHANDERFDNYRCLPFQNLIICSTGITSVPERKKLEKMVNDNGGIFTGKLSLSNTDILVCSGKNCTNSDKFKAARQQKNIKCVILTWVTDSIQKGYALPHTNYQVQKMTSTPTKEQVNPEFSMISAIGGPNMSQAAFVEDTMAGFLSPEKTRSSGKRKASVFNYESMVESLDIKKVKKAGQYLDGCSVYLTGFGPEHIEKLNKIINLSGATRYSNFSDRVTHVIVGDSHCNEVNLIRKKATSCSIVNIQWLIDSIDSGQPVPEESYLLYSSHMEGSDITSSPLSKKGLSLLLSKTVTENELKSNFNNSPHLAERAETDIVQQYLKQGSTTQEDTLAKLLEGVDNSNFAKQIPDSLRKNSSMKPQNISTQDSSASATEDGTSEMPIQIFEHLKFMVIGFDEEEYSLLKDRIEYFCGELVPKTYKGIADYLVVPIFNDKDVHYTATNVVNNLFIRDCEGDEEIKEIAYYHKPFNQPESEPLEGCVITLSSYSGCERIFLKQLVEALGGISQEQFARVTSQAKGVMASTHLVTVEATGKKYEAALKWGLPVVDKEWLLECYKTGKRVLETEYSIITARVPQQNPKTLTPEQLQNHNSASNDASKGPLTPTASPGPSRINRVLTPINQMTPHQKRFMDSAEKPFSQVTPINKIMQNFREDNQILNPSVQKEVKEYTIPPLWSHIKTPNTPLGACLTPNPSPNLRKQWEYWLMQFPDKSSPKSTASTPLSEIKKQLWNKVLKKDGMEQPNFNDVEADGTNENVEISSQEECIAPSTPENQQLVSKLQQLEDMLTASGGGGRRQSTKFHATLPAPGASLDFKDSQPCTVGWDFQDQEPERRVKRTFSLSGIVDDTIRSVMVLQIEQLGGAVSDLANYDPSCTHLLCLKPARNEKSLSCMAAGKWVLHTSYLEKSQEAGHFLDEEEFEFGNPKSAGKFGISSDRDTEIRMQRMHWWRKEISKRGYKAFNDMRAIVVAQKREPIIRVIEAGGGTVVDIGPPFEDTVHATHCLLEPKSVKDFSLYIPLARQGVYLVNTIFISDYLHNPDKDIRDCILPYFSKYYARG